MIDAWSSNDELVAGGAQRRGYMGHLTKICNDVLASADKGPYSSLVSTLLTGWYNYYVSDSESRVDIYCTTDLKSGSAIISHDRSLSIIYKMVAYTPNVKSTNPKDFASLWLCRT